MTTAAQRRMASARFRRLAAPEPQETTAEDRLRALEGELLLLKPYRGKPAVLRARIDELHDLISAAYRATGRALDV